jgi:hypothetical protein
MRGWPANGKHYGNFVLDLLPPVSFSAQLTQLCWHCPSTSTIDLLFTPPTAPALRMFVNAPRPERSSLSDLLRFLVAKR